MVRLKHRYLLINILYPSSSATPSSGAGRTPSTAGHLPTTIDFHQPTSDKLTPQLLVRLIRDGVAELFGDYGSGMTAASLVVKYFSPATSTAIIRVSRDHYRLVWAALSFVTRLPRACGEQDCVIQVVRVSGTIRKAEEEAIRRAKASIVRAQRRDEGNGVLGKMLREGDGGSNVSMGGIVDEDEDDDEDMDED